MITTNMKKYNNITDKFEFKSMEEAIAKKNEIKDKYMQVVVCPVWKYKKEVWKVHGNFQAV